MLRNARRTAFGLALTAVLITTGCSALGSSDAPPSGQGSGALEKTSITVATVPTVDLAPFWRALEGGYFKAQGLDVREMPNADTKTALTKVISGEADIGLATYPSMFTAKAAGQDLVAVADGTSASPKSNEIVTVPGSPVKTVQDLAGRKIAISSRTQSSGILTKSVMRDNGVDFANVQWVEMPFPNMAPALQRGDVVAAYMPEPFLTQTAKTAGAIPVIDAASGSSRDIPITGYTSSGKWAQANPKTLAAFQRAMRDATRDATKDRATIEAAVVAHAKVPADIAALMTLPNFQSKLDAQRLQRVPDLLQLLGIINTKIDAATMIAPQAA